MGATVLLLSGLKSHFLCVFNLCLVFLCSFRQGVSCQVTSTRRQQQAYYNLSLRRDLVTPQKEGQTVQLLNWWETRMTTLENAVSLKSQRIHMQPCAIEQLCLEDSTEAFVIKNAFWGTKFLYSKALRVTPEMKGFLKVSTIFLVEFMILR